MGEANWDMSRGRRQGPRPGGPRRAADLGSVSRGPLMCPATPLQLINVSPARRR